MPHTIGGVRATNGHRDDTKIRRFRRWASRFPRLDSDTIRLQSSRKRIIITKNKLRNVCTF